MKILQRHRRTLKSLDRDTAERMFTGLAADDAPPGYADVAELFAAAAAPAEPLVVAADHAALVAFRVEMAEGVAVAPRRRFNPWATLAGRVGVVAAAGAIVISGGVAAAATGSLPEPVQRFAHQILGGIGVPPVSTPANPDVSTLVSTIKTADATVQVSPEPNHGAAVTSVARSVEPGPEHGAAVASVAGSVDPESGHGAAVTSVARSVDPGPGHGAAVCAIASNDACRAGDSEAADKLAAQPPAARGHRGHHGTPGHEATAPGAKGDAVTSAVRAGQPGPGFGATICQLASGDSCAAGNPGQPDADRSNGSRSPNESRDESRGGQDASGELAQEQVTTTTTVLPAGD